MLAKIKDSEGKVWEYHADDRIWKYGMACRGIINKKDKDHVVIVDGYEGSGKSTFAMQLGRIVDPTLSLERICMTAEEFKEGIKKATRGQCVIYDEAVTGLSSSDAISKIGRLLKSMMMQMRQKNLFIIVLIPTVFELNRYAVLSRAKALFHIYERGGNRGYFVGYNKKDLKKLYLKGKKSQSYVVRSFFTGRFYGKYVVDEEEYRKKKEEALFLTELEDEPSNKYINQRNFWIKSYKKLSKKSYTELAEMAKKEGISISIAQISRICGK